LKLFQHLNFYFTLKTSDAKLKLPSTSNSIGEVVGTTLASIASPIASRRKVAISIPRSSKAQQSPVKTRTKVMMTSRSAGGRSSSDVQERSSDKVEKHQEKLSAGVKHANL
jgi:hypothetical protein